MNNYIKPGKTMTYTAPAGGVVAGSVYLIGGLFVVALFTAAAGAQFEGATEGVFLLTKLAGEGALVEGQPLYWDVANSRCSIDHAVGLPIGSVATVGGNLTADVTVQVRLHGLSLVGRILTVRKRLTIAQVNAGAVLVPAYPGLKPRLVDSLAIAVGGAVTTVTTVDILGVSASAARKLVAHAQASMTQSAVLRAGGAGAAVLADGASFTQNDVNTAITANITGAAITVATAIDFEVNYALE